jgi:CDP-paratose 2-epimerase
MKYKSMLITGGAGFVGSNLAVSFKLKYPRLKVTALDNLKRRGSEMNIARLRDHGIDFLHADIRCPEDLALDGKVDLLIECSAEPSVLSGLKDNPAYIIHTNLTGTVNCLELARRHKADVIFLSTSRVYPYGELNKIKAQESGTRFEWKAGQRFEGWSREGVDVNFTTSGPKTFYGATKLASELLLEEYIANYGIKGVINRCGVIAGPWQFGKVDQGVFTFWLLNHYFKKEIKYIGFGGKGKQVRDLLHVDDIFRLIDLQADRLDDISGEVYNAGGGRPVSLSLFETTKLCEKISGNRIRISQETRTRPADVMIYLTDNRKATQELGWSPKKSARDILLDTYAWIHKNEKQVKQSLCI